MSTATQQTVEGLLPLLERAQAKLTEFERQYELASDALSSARGKVSSLQYSKPGARVPGLDYNEAAAQRYYDRLHEAQREESDAQRQLASAERLYQHWKHVVDVIGSVISGERQLAEWEQKELAAQARLGELRRELTARASEESTLKQKYAEALAARNLQAAALLKGRLNVYPDLYRAIEQEEIARAESDLRNAQDNVDRRKVKLSQYRGELTRIDLSSI